jgi:hypothetical protein
MAIMNRISLERRQRKRGWKGRRKSVEEFPKEEWAGSWCKML